MTAINDAELSKQEGDDQLIRLNRYLREAGVDSRRHCDEIIASGRVRVNNQVVDQLGSKVNPATDVVEVDGQVVSLPQSQVTIMLNKPRENSYSIPRKNRSSSCRNIAVSLLQIWSSAIVIIALKDC